MECCRPDLTARQGSGILLCTRIKGHIGMQHLPIHEIGGNAARDMADLTGIRLDLQRASEMLQYLLENPEMPLILRDSLFTSSLIIYRRCFTKNVRQSLTHDHINSIGNNANELHEHIINQANKLAAHSVNPFENTKVGIIVNGEQIEGACALTARLVEWDAQGYKQWIRLINTINNEILTPALKEIQAAVIADAKRRPLKDILRGPEISYTAPQPEAARQRR